MSVVDNRDDTFHLYLGPFHISLGPAIFGALHFKNVSTALLATSGSKVRADSINQSTSRRREAVLRRFRRCVRKLIFLKSVINQIQLASILTPYNQYALYKQGIYDLVLSGHLPNSCSLFNDDGFIEQVNNFRSAVDADSKSPLLSSKYVKINSLLNLLSTNTPQNQPDTISGMGNLTQAMSENPIDFGINENNPPPLIEQTPICCSEHGDDQNALVSIKRRPTYSSNQLLSAEYTSNLGSNQSLHKGSNNYSNRKQTVSFKYELQLE